MQEFMSLKYEPASEPLPIYVSANGQRERARSVQRERALSGGSGHRTTSYELRVLDDISGASWTISVALAVAERGDVISVARGRSHPFCDCHDYLSVSTYLTQCIY